MFSLSTVTTTFASTQKKFKKFGKKLRKQRDGEVDSIKDKLIYFFNFNLFKKPIIHLNTVSNILYDGLPINFTQKSIDSS